jgi:hypothetical protein
MFGLRLVLLHQRRRSDAGQLLRQVRHRYYWTMVNGDRSSLMDSDALYIVNANKSTTSRSRQMHWRHDGGLAEVAQVFSPKAILRLVPGTP